MHSTKADIPSSLFLICTYTYMQWKNIMNNIYDNSTREKNTHTLTCIAIQKTQLESVKIRKKHVLDLTKSSNTNTGFS